MVTAARQQITAEWWSARRPRFSVRVSEIVVREARTGDGEAVQRRLNALDGIPLLALTADVLQLASYLIDCGAVPTVASVDAAHISVATVHGAEFLLTWNCRHIANAEMRQRIEEACRHRGYEPPVLCTPEELMGS